MRHGDINMSEGHLGGYVHGGDPATWTPDLWRWAYGTLGVRSMLDVGCGEGQAAKFFSDLGCRVLGVDGSALAARDTQIPQHHIKHDYNNGVYLPATDFDLVWSSEFVEHVEERYAKHFLATFECAAKYLMMTYAQPGQGGHHHVNCQHAEYWIDKIEPLGFAFDETRTLESRALAGVSHFHDRGLVFERR